MGDGGKDRAAVLAKSACISESLKAWQSSSFNPLGQDGRGKRIDNDVQDTFGHGFSDDCRASFDQHCCCSG